MNILDIVTSKTIRSLLTLAVATYATSSSACDLCSLYSSIESQKPKAGTFHFGIAEQFTGYDKLQEGGRFLENTAHQHLESSITQTFVGYDLSHSTSLQLSLPYINRRYKRVEGEAIEKGTEAGIGDLSLIARYNPIDYNNGEKSFLVQIFGGVKLPTGDSDRLAEELAESSSEESDMEPMSQVFRHGAHHHDEGPAGAVHGHDLALGSGSVDFPIGLLFQARKDRFFLSGETQYTIRTEGDHSYQYANDLMWSVGPGYYLSTDHALSLAGRFALSGDYKGKDTGPGDEKQGDTAINSLYIGPELLLSSESGIGGELGLELPVSIENSGVQAVPTYRLRAAVNFRF